MLILGKRFKLSSLSGVYIKPDFSPKERATETMLLKERKLLIAAGTEKKSNQNKKSYILLIT